MNKPSGYMPEGLFHREDSRGSRPLPLIGRTHAADVACHSLRGFPWFAQLAPQRAVSCAYAAFPFTIKGIIEII